ncbi:MAG: acyloxyacyl hydrolase [Candidatus Ratteibacteria bacterium]|nr:acyloxyacyl hydrolase [Candidatus Ratteibacteria bacterium]
MRKWCVSSFVFLCICASLFAFDIRKPEGKEVFITYGWDDHLKNKGEYVHHTLGVDFCYPMPWKNFQFQLEPFVSLVSSPDVNAEVGLVFFIKYTFPIKFPVKPYVRGGSGVILITQDTEEQSTMFNFASQSGYGLSIDIGKNKYLLLEYRNRHVSNADIKQPNSGIDSYIWLLGVGGDF